METFEKDSQQSGNKEPDDNQGGIRRRLRDRDLLRKRKAEAEEKETYQWVYGVQSKRPRVRRDKSSSSQIGRPKKSNLGSQLQPSLEDLPQDASKIGEELSQRALEVEAETSPKIQPLSPPIPLLAPVLPEAPGESLPVPSEKENPDHESKTSQPVEEVLIEDLGPDESEDNRPLPEKLTSDRVGILEGTSDDLPGNTTDNVQLFSVPTYTLSPQQDNLEGSFI